MICWPKPSNATGCWNRRNRKKNASRNRHAHEVETMSLLSRCKRLFNRPHLRLIALVGVIVPRRLRANWRQEWEAELRHREAMLAEWDRLDWRARLDLMWRSKSAFWDALWLQPQRWEDEMMQDIRFGVRMLLKSKAFTAVAVLMLALGIGANTAVFSIVDAVLLQALPYAEPERLVVLGGLNRQRGNGTFTFSHQQWQVLQEQHQAFAEMAGYAGESFTLTGVEEPERLQATRVSASF